MLPLFAIFVGLGSSQSVLAQSTIATASISLNVKGSPVTYDAKPTTGGGTNFANRDFGSFDISTDVFAVTNGVLTINEDPSESYDQAVLRVRVAPGTLGSTVSVGFTDIPLVNAGLSNGVRTFTPTTAGYDILAAVTSPASGGSYRFDINFVATDNTNVTTLSTGLRKSVFTATGTRVNPTSAGPPVNAQSTILINTTGATTPNTTYTASAFNGTNLGTYDINDGKLTLNGGTLNTFESGGDVIQSARLQYLIVKPPQNSQPGFAFPQSEIALIQDGTGTAGNGGTNRSFSNSTALRNLISGLANQGIGTYTVTVTYEAVVLRANGTTFRVRDDNGGNGYTASFNTTGVPILIDTWTGGTSDDWFTPANWDLKIVPTANINVVIPDFGVGNTKPYPNIHAGAVYTFGSTTINNTNSGDAMCRNVDMQGSSQAQRSLCRLYQGRWKVYGGFSNLFDSYRQFDGSRIEFAGSGNQTITGGSFTDVDLSGAGTKALQGIMTISNSMNFLAGSGLFTTDISTPDNNYVTLGDRSGTAANGAQLTGETDSGYIRGFVRTSRTDVRANEVDAQGKPDPRTFGNIGVTLLFAGTNNPGDIIVTRNTAESYTPLVPSNGGTSRFGIRRIFGVRPSTTQPLVATMTFRYLDTELSNLGPQGNGSVPEPNLALFVSTSGGNQFGGLGRDALDQTNNILTKSGVRTFATFTLGDRDNPLPVSLTGFDAKRLGADALITWQTASEQNNKGFNVQVSADGKTYRNVGFVASETPNSTTPKAYTFTDTEKNKAGARYYRLEQLDVDGKSTFFAPRVVTFDGKAAETNTSIVAYPNPLNNEILHLSLNSSVSGTAVVRILDMTGRQVGQRQVAITLGSNDVPVENMSELKSGLYILNVMLPSGEKKTMKVTKQ
ncbi:T9SS type A sorting domain-containing protein [Hymenobacter sp. DH14]|uniref:T9SS type A sorting domain-containing protein n=1 Tax=Hymenobacter cyanobacteriorum TaxID=2926463 RepID=A0A9X1VHT7_9BACT|nr:T9SS type A sorting domain-containing protein [Hymenobacter cyanobacteriorum]MCI1188537.1 T9SS type A sorting domain-containing protein [Hymenobacter cyanobacteriorum]